MSRLSAGFVFPHDLAAFSAEAMAFSASSSEAELALYRGLWSRGEMTSKVEDEVTSLPSSHRGTVEEALKLEGGELVPFVAIFARRDQFEGRGNGGQ